MDDSLLHCYQEQIEKLLRLIIKEVNPISVILFGSAAREEFRPDSDVDVFVVVV